MALQRKTPGVYIVEQNAFPNSVVPVATSVPVFIGYTETAMLNGKSCAGEAVAIENLAEYETVFGKGPGQAVNFSLQPAMAGAVGTPLQPVVTLAGKPYQLGYAGHAFYLYNSLRLYFLNGGGRCYILSVGNYSGTCSLADFSNALTKLEKVIEPAIVLAPDAVSLQSDDFIAFTNELLTHCGSMQSRVAILDVAGGSIADPALSDQVMEDFRNGVNSNYLSYGAAYFPWVRAGVVNRAEISFMNLPDHTGDFLENDTAVQDAWKKAVELRSSGRADAVAIAAAQKELTAKSPSFTQLMDAALDLQNVLPPSGAIAGVYVLTDNERSVSRAPANVMLASVLSPTVAISDEQNMAMNIPLNGKAINAIRAFQMKGVLVWGARTLDGNSDDWRYINVRRTLIFIEQSIKQATEAYVFEPNTANTWVTVKAMIENFLTDCWKQGVLVGTKADDAFMVNIGLGSTMTAQDILDGFMKVSVMLAVSHPAEFIEITFQQQMQKS